METLQALFEDEWLVAVDKPAGLLSQPGIRVNDSVHTRMLAQRADLSGPVLVHRLDMDTSGVMVLAKTRAVHRALQQQFERREVNKRYVARVAGPLPGVGGQITLPLRLDIDNRPFQVACLSHGKAASTCWRADAVQENRVILLPRTGRTHQLRVHLAHPRGLGVPIIGDRLYGVDSVRGVPVGHWQAGQHHGACPVASRLMLHAEMLAITHPTSGERLHFVSPAPF